MKWRESMLAAAMLVGGLFGLPPHRAGAHGTAAEPAGPTPVLRFAVLSDLHVNGSTEAARRLERALTDLRSTVPDAQALVLNGDLGDGHPSDYERLRGILERTRPPGQVFSTIGNHEFYSLWYDRFRRWNPDAFPNGAREEEAIARFLAWTGEPQVYYEREVQGYRFLFLGSERYRLRQPEAGEDAWLSPAQLQWLETRLAAAPEGLPVFVFLHQPLPDTVAGSSSQGGEQGVVQHRELKAVLKRHPRVVLFSGHTHWELGLPRTFVEDGGLAMAGSSSVSSPYRGAEGPYPAAARRSEGLIVEAYPDLVRIRGRAFGSSSWIPGADHILHYLP